MFVDSLQEYQIFDLINKSITLKEKEVLEMKFFFPGGLNFASNSF